MQMKHKHVHAKKWDNSLAEPSVRGGKVKATISPVIFLRNEQLKIHEAVPERYQEETFSLKILLASLVATQTQFFEVALA